KRSRTLLDVERYDQVLAVNRDRAPHIDVGPTVPDLSKTLHYQIRILPQHIVACASDARRSESEWSRLTGRDLLFERLERYRVHGLDVDVRQLVFLRSVNFVYELCRRSFQIGSRRRGHRRKKISLCLSVLLKPPRAFFESEFVKTPRRIKRQSLALLFVVD